MQQVLLQSDIKVDLTSMKEFNWNEGYRPFIELFIEEFIPTEYDYEELVLFSNELDTLFYKINQRIFSRIGELEEEDFNQLMDILNNANCKIKLEK